MEARLMEKTFHILGLLTKDLQSNSHSWNPPASKGTVRHSRWSSKRLFLKSKCYGKGGKSSSYPTICPLSTPLPNSSYLEPAFIPTACSNPTSHTPEREKTLFDLLFSKFSSQLLPSVFWRILKQRHFPQSSIFSCYSEGPCMKNLTPANTNDKCRT